MAQYCAGVDNCQETAQDLTQNLFEAVLRSRKSYNPKVRPLRNWLYGIAAHVLYDYRRRTNRGIELVERIGLDIQSTGVSGIDEDPMLAVLVRAVNDLSPTQRKAFLEHALNDQSYAEIAGRLSCSEPGARQSVSRATRTVRAKVLAQHPAEIQPGEESV